MEESKDQNPQRRNPQSLITQIEAIKHRINENLQKQNYNDIHCCLQNIKMMMEPMINPENRVPLAELINTLLKVFEDLMSCPDLDPVNFSKKEILEIFGKVPFDQNKLGEIYPKIMTLILLILNKESEELGVIAAKMYLDYYKNIKGSLDIKFLERYLEFAFKIYEDYDKMLNENFHLILTETTQPFRLKSTKSFKITTEIPLNIAFLYQLYPAEIDSQIKHKLPTLIKIFKLLKNNPYKDAEYDKTKKIQINLYEEYLYNVTKLLYLMNFILRLKGYDELLKPHGREIVGAIIHILSNTPKDNIHLRKEILTITKSLITYFSDEFFLNFSYFLNEENLLGRSVISYDHIYFEANKVFISLIKNVTIRNKLNFDQNVNLVENLIMKINNFRISFENKIEMFDLIHDYCEHIKQQNHPDMMVKKTKIITLTTKIFRELSSFFEILDKIYKKIDTPNTQQNQNLNQSSPIINSNNNNQQSEKYNKNIPLDRNFFEPDESLLLSKMPFQENLLIHRHNINRIYELFLHNEFEKYVNTDELTEILKRTNKLLLISVQLINFEQNQRDNLMSSKILTRRAQYLKKLFENYFRVCEYNYKNHSHIQTSNEQEFNPKIHEISLVKLYLTFPTNLCLLTYHKLMPFIFEIITYNYTKCQRNCVMTNIIEGMFDNSDQNNHDVPLKKELIEMTLDFYMSKIQYIGNNLKNYEGLNDGKSTTQLVLVNIFKLLFKCLLNFPLEEKMKIKITNFLIHCLILIKKSIYFGNYTYIIRCLFKNLLPNTNSHSPHQQSFEFYKETIHLIYGILKYLINLKEDFPFIKDIITEIIMIFPIKFKYIIDYAKIVFPSLLEALNMNPDIIPVGLQYLEQWINVLWHKPETVKPYFQANINTLTNLLNSHLYKNYSISLNSLKLLSKFGGKSRNYFEDKLINPKTSPTNILVVELQEFSTNKVIELSIDNIVDLCIKLVTNYRKNDKTVPIQLKISFNALKSCMQTFIQDSVDVAFIEKCLDDIKANKNAIDFNEIGYFNYPNINMNQNQPKINIIYRKAEHFLVEKLLRGLFLCCTITEIEENVRKFVKFICDYFTIIMIIKNNNNRSIHTFEIDPTIILDIICEFLFSKFFISNPMIFKNANQTCINIAQKLINMIIDCIETLFDKNYEIIKNLEIVDILYLKFLNLCYNNEWSKKGGGLIILIILVNRFSKEITFKYFKNILKTIFFVTQNYPTVVKIKYEGDVEDILRILLKLFCENFKEKKDVRELKQVYLVLKSIHFEILENLNSKHKYTRKIAKILYKQVLEITKISQELFFYFDSISEEQFILNFGEDQLSIIKLNISNETYLINDTFKKLTSCLDTKMEFSSTNFLPMIAAADALSFLIKNIPESFNEYILSSRSNFEKFLKIIKNMFEIVLSDMFLYLEINSRLHQIQFNSKFKYFFLEKFYTTKVLHFEMQITANGQQNLIENYIQNDLVDEVCKYIFYSPQSYIFDHYSHTNASYSPIDPLIYDIFPLVALKMKMIQKFIKLKKYIFSNRSLLTKIREFENSNQNPESNSINKLNIEMFFNIKNKCTNLIFRIIIYREEKSLLKSSKNYIKRLLQTETNTRNLLPEEELKKCVKPILEQLASNRTMSYKLIESLAILLKLLSSNFNSTLGNKLLEHLKTGKELAIESNGCDISLVYALLSLFSYLKVGQIRDIIDRIFEIIMELEKDSYVKNKINSSLFNSKYKVKIIKLLSNFSNQIIDIMMKKPFIMDHFNYSMLKKLIKEECAYVLRDAITKNLRLHTGEILKDCNLDYIINYVKIINSMCSKNPSFLKNGNGLFEEFILFYQNSVYEIYKDFRERDKNLDNILKILSKIFIQYSSKFNKHNYIILLLSKYMKVTKCTRIKEKIKFYLLKDLYKNIKVTRLVDILKLFLVHYNDILKFSYLDSALKYIVIPIIIYYIKNRISSHYVENVFIQGLCSISLLEENKRKYDDATNLEIIKLNLIVFLNFLKENNNEYKSEIHSYIFKQYYSSSQSLSLYSCLGISILPLKIMYETNKLQISFNIFLKQNPYDNLSIINLCLDIIFPILINRINRNNVNMTLSQNNNLSTGPGVIQVNPVDEGLALIKFIKTFINDKSNSNQYFHIFHLILRNYEFFTGYRQHLNQVIIQLIIRCTQQPLTLSNLQKKTIIQLIGLIIYWIKLDITEKKQETNPNQARFNDNALILLNKYYKILFYQNSSNAKDYEQEILDIIKKYLLYVREFIRIADFSFKNFFIVTENEILQEQIIKFISGFLYLLKLVLLYLNKNSIIEHLEYILNLMKNLMKFSYIKPINEITLLIRFVTSEEYFEKLNENKEKIKDETKKAFNEMLTKNIKENFDIYAISLTNTKKYKGLSEEIENLNNAEFKNADVLKNLLTSFKSRNNASGNNNEKLLIDTFPHYEFRAFYVLYYCCIERGLSYDGLEIVTKSFFEIFFYYVMAFNQVFREDEKFKKNFDLVDNQEYISSDLFYAGNIKNLDRLEKAKNIEKFLEKNLKLYNPEKISSFEILIDTVILGFSLFLTNKSIMNYYKSNFTKAFILWVELFQNFSNLQNLIEIILREILDLQIYTSNEKLSLIFDILKAYDYSNKKVLWILLNLFVDYLKNYNGENNKHLKDIIKALLLASKFQEYKIRKNTYRLFEKFYGKSLFSKLKWVFQIDQKNPDIDNSCWLSFAVDFFLNHLQYSKKISKKQYSLKLKSLCFPHKKADNKNNSEIEDIEMKSETNEKYSFLTLYNEEIEKIESKSILIPIRDIVLGDLSFAQKMWLSIFPQIWKILSKDEQEFFSVYFNDFLLSISSSQSPGYSQQSRSPIIAKAMIEAFGNCEPLIKINPEILYSLAKNQNCWNSSIFYLEKNVISNVYKERSYFSLNKIFETLKEEDHNFGLKRFMTNDKFSIASLSYLQCSEFYKAENVLKEAFKTYSEQLNIEGDEFENKIDFGIWEDATIEVYRNTNKWKKLLEFSEKTNNLETKVECLWQLEEWKEIDQVKLLKNHYLKKMNQIYKMMKEEINKIENYYQQICMEGIQVIFSDFKAYPQSFERLNYHYYLIFQQIVEAWESTNTLKEIERNIRDKKPPDFRENLFVWRDRIPHVSEGIMALKSIIDPRDCLFKIIRDNISTNYNENAASIMPNVSDHIWNNFIFIKYARKLKLNDVYYEKLELFEKNIAGNEKHYPTEIFMKNIEVLKFTKKVSKDYLYGLNFTEGLILGNYNNDPDFLGLYKGYQAYFKYKLSQTLEANELFKEAIGLNSNDYRIWNDWAEMNDYQAEKRHRNSNSTDSYANAIIAYMMTIIFKLDKAKFIFPRILYLLKVMQNVPNINFNYELLKKYIDNVPIWIFNFFIPQLIKLLKYDNLILPSYILEKLSSIYPQYIFFPLKNLGAERISDETKKVLIKVLANLKKSHLFYKLESLQNEIKNKIVKKQDEGYEEILGITQTLLDYYFSENIGNLEQNLKKAIFKIIDKVYPPTMGARPVKTEFMPKFVEELKTVDRETNLYNIYLKLKKLRDFLHSKTTTESNFRDIHNVLSSVIYTGCYDELEIPGYFSNKFVEPMAENKVYISRVESEFNQKTINTNSKKLLIRGSNEKIYNFIVQTARVTDLEYEPRVLQIMALLNHCFALNKDSYKRNIKFNLPIKYNIGGMIRIVQEENSQYYFNEIYEFCMQKNGFDPDMAEINYCDLAYNKVIPPENLIDQNRKEQYLRKQIYDVMSEKIPVYSLKNFIHKFIMNSDEIFIFRKQFATSFALNNFLNYSFRIYERNLQKISINKESGSVTFHESRLNLADLKKTDYKEVVPFRLTKNFSYFLSPTCLYSIIPEVMHSSSASIINKEFYVKPFVYCVIYDEIKDDTSIVNENIENKLRKIELNTNLIFTNIKNIHNNPDELKVEKETVDKVYPHKFIMDLIKESISDDNLSKMNITWNPWF